MKQISIKKEDNKIVITTETNRFLRKPKIRIFIGLPMTSSFWSWLELPDKTLVCDYLSFQLSAWARD